jgi:hypothetical protein
VEKIDELHVEEKDELPVEKIGELSSGCDFRERDPLVEIKTV